MSDLTYALVDDPDDPDMVRRSDGTFIPSDPRQADWQGYQAWIADGNTATPYVAPPAPVPETISDRQFFQQLAVQGVISQAEALAAVKTGTVPASMAALVAALPADQQFSAEMLISGATIFERNNPLTQTLAAAFGWSSDQADTFWRAAAAL